MLLQKADNITRLLLAVYLLVLLWILVFKMGVRFSYMDTRSVNLAPFARPVMSHGRIGYGEMILNNLVFLPLGVYVSLLCRGKVFGKHILAFIAVSLLIETVQYLLRIGAFDITDIITNTTGAIMGALAVTGLRQLFTDHLKVQRFVNIIAGIATILLVCFLVLLKFNLLPVRYQ